MNQTFAKCLTKVLEELINELSKISVDVDAEPPRKAAKIIQPVHEPKRKLPKLAPKIPIIESEESVFVKQEPPEEIEQNVSDFTNYPEPGPSTSQVDNENPENVTIKGKSPFLIYLK